MGITGRAASARCKSGMSFGAWHLTSANICWTSVGRIKNTMTIYNLSKMQRTITEGNTNKIPEVQKLSI